MTNEKERLSASTATCTAHKKDLNPPWFASVVIDISTRALTDPFTYAIPTRLFSQAQVGCCVVVPFAAREALGYIVKVSASLGELSDDDELSLNRIKPLHEVLSPPLFSERSAALAFWLSDEYVAPLADCMRLFLPPGARPKMHKQHDGSYALVSARTKPQLERWVFLTEAGRSWEPRAGASRQRTLLDALSCGPVSTRELKLLYTDMSASIRTLQKKGVIDIAERRAWRGLESAQTTLSSACADAPEKLTQGQLEALAAIDDAQRRGRGDVVVVDGVTGSGKTEVYLSAIEKVLSSGKSACVLVPEISLTAQTLGRFRSRFGSQVALFHSRLSAGERFDQWDMVKGGIARVVVGARSALFCPFEDLGIIIIDEEHEQSYKQGSLPRYHAREVAARLAQLCGCPLVLGSATPSATALYRSARGGTPSQKWTRVVLPERATDARLPHVHVVDLTREFMAGSRSIFSRELACALLNVAHAREKAIILHNRRGFAPFLMCRECGCVPTCTHCSTSLTYHERTHTLECHTCGSSWRVRPYPHEGSACPRCHSRYLAKMGLGTQQLEDALRALLPQDVAIIRMDADSTRGKDAHKRLLEEFDAAECAVLVGTQMIAKGLDFPEVTLVGVINADYMLKLPDFRAGERTFALLEQVAGRAGRGDRPGKVIIQSYVPDDPVIQAVAIHRRELFTQSDAETRASALYPPYVRLSNVLAWGENAVEVRAYMERLAACVRALCTEEVSATHTTVKDDDGTPSLVAPRILGPVPCVIARAKDRWRFHFIVKSPLGYHVSRVLRAALAAEPVRSHIHVSVDIDAYDLM